MSPAPLAPARVWNLAWPAPHCPFPSHPVTRVSEQPHQQGCSGCFTEAPLGLTRQETLPWSSGVRPPAHTSCTCAHCWAHLCSGALGNQGNGASTRRCRRPTKLPVSRVSARQRAGQRMLITVHLRTCCFRGCFRNGFVLHEDKN